MKSILTVIGTRPEAIKLAPILSAIHQSQRFVSKVCITKQHTDLLDPFILDLKITAQYHLKSDGQERALHKSAAQILERFSEVLVDSKPDLVIVQGDTTTAFTSALAAFYAKIPVAHIEAGLRTDSLDEPWPEEAHRCLIDRLATYFFAPTEQAKLRLLLEGVPSDKVWVVGNTSIDAIRLALKQSPKLSIRSQKIVVTVHRRENHGQRLEKICQALRSLAQQFPKVRFLFLLHPNPHIRGPATTMLSGVANIELLEPMDHISFIQLLNESLFVVTDSGGIQEETSFLGKPVLVLRDTTERPESILVGTSRLVGTESSVIMACCKELIENEELRTAMSKVHFSYGDGYAAEKIIHILEQELRQNG
jgi:UDP-N-acetylglucosamine 2-epimerase (non-hydrolysing)